MTAPAPPVPDATRAFRQLMGQFATGVAVISLVPPGGGVSAMTINSLVSISLDPMLVSWSLKNAASLYDAFAGAEHFAFSILAQDQQAIARRYAARGDSALVAGDFEEGSGGLPVIRGALAHIACRRFAVHPAGDHTLILGEVIGMGQGAAGGRPLMFFGGQFGEMAA